MANPDVITRMAEGEAAQAAFDRFVAPALDALRADAVNKIAKLSVQAMEGRVLAGVQALSHQLRAADEVEKQLRALILDAKVERDAAEREGRQAKMSPEERKWSSL